LLYALYRMGYHSRATAHGFRATASTILNEHGFRPDVKLPTFRGQFQTGTMALGGMCHGTQGTPAPYPGVQA
jgi:hypothetical protein